ncbi:hypothetical protein N0B51_00055 [Tsuneonella sp. YG55]|uniref:Phage terminase, small subunit n=1 Tax=Tsuneonella litorea TaxID=2976475 RepID=A0A9X2VYE5_9SPHN|nr:hypothetical protein [Tsuneonella litorea]MCT2557368.1 hypothetical protein [Tsuneonella litorea]
MTEKPKKPRRPRVDSTTGIAAAIVAGGKQITLPEGTKFDAFERKVFTELCDEFSKTELTPHKVRLLVSLARQIVMLSREQEALTREGFVLTNSHGNAVPNPRVKACAGLTSSILAMRRSLGIHTRAQEGGSNQKAAVRRAHNKANEAERGNYDDNLIAFPKPLEEVDDDG